MRRTLCMIIVLQTSLASSQGIQGDVKYIRCGVCELLIGELHGHLERNPGLRKEEASILSALEDVQNPESSAGGWMRSIDLVESGDRLELERHKEDGPCGRECATIKLACAALLDEGWDNELSEALYSGASLSQLRADACREWSTACRKEPPKLDRNRAAGPPFRAFTDEERAARDLRLGKPPPPGMLTEAALRQRLAVIVHAPDEETDMFGEPSSHAAKLEGLAHAAAFAVLDT